MSKKLSIASAVMTALAAVMAVLLLSITPALAHHSEDHAQGGGAGSTTTSEEQGTQGAENTPGNDRKEGYEDNSTTPHEPNQGKGSDKDGDADADSNTAYTEDNDTNDGGTPNNQADEGDNAHPSGKDRSVENGGSGNQGRSESNPDDSKGPMRYEGAQGDDKPNGPGGTDLADQDGNNGCGNDDDFNDDNNGWCGKPQRITPPKDNNKPVVCDADMSKPGIQKCEEVKGGVINSPVKPCDADATMPGIQKCEEVKGVVIDRPCDKDNNMANGVQPCDKPNEVLPELEVNPSVPEDEVKGELIERAKNPAGPEAPSVLGIRLAPALAQPVAVAGAVLPFTGGEALTFLIAAFALILAGAAAMRFRRSEA